MRVKGARRAPDDESTPLWVKINLYLLGGIFHFRRSEYGSLLEVWDKFLLITFFSLWDKKNPKPTIVNRSLFYKQTSKKTPNNTNTANAWSWEDELNLIFAKEYDVSLVLYLKYQHIHTGRKSGGFYSFFSFWLCTILCWEASCKYAVWLLHLCVVWVLSEIA